MTLIIMLGLYFIVVTNVEQQLLPNQPGKRSYMAPILVFLSFLSCFVLQIVMNIGGTIIIVHGSFQNAKKASA